jgi:hypothetical protein
MKRDPYTAWLPLRDELIVDNFAGGVHVGYFFTCFQASFE